MPAPTPLRPAETPTTDHPPEKSYSTINATADGGTSTGMHVPAGLQAEIGDIPEIPGYDILAVLAQGGMGYVLQAREVGLNRLAAIKLPLANRQSPRDRDRFLREAQSAAGLRHPNICQIHRVGTAADGTPFIAMEFLEGKTLKDDLREQPPSPRDAATLLATLAGAVAYAHGHGIVHRDLKPANVMVLADGRQPVLTDFGLAKDLGETDAQITQAGQVLGTPAFMAPEQAAGRTAEVGPAADVYALGAILYQMLTGEPPFRGRSGEVLRQVQTEDPVPPRKRSPKVHRDLETICLKCLAKRPADRYASADDLRQDLECFAAGEPIAARRAGVVRRLAVRARRNGVAVAIVGVLLVAAVAAGGYALATRGEQQSAQAAERITSAIAEDLKQPGDWAEDRVARLDALTADLDRLDAGKAATAREQIAERLFDSARQRLQQTVRPEDRQYVDRIVAVLRERDVGKADRLIGIVKEREGQWQPAFRIIANDGGKAIGAELFDGRGVNQNEFRDNAIYLTQPHSNGELSAYPTTVSSSGQVLLKVQFAPGWDQATVLGLALNRPGSARGGYELLLRPRIPGKLGGTFAEARKSDAAATVQLLRNQVVLREDQLAILGLGEGPLSLMLQREGDRLTGQVNQLRAIESRDLFALGGDGVFAIVATPGTPMRWLEGQTRLLPAAPSPLERGDALLLAGNYLAALAFYQQQAIATTGTPAEREARFKEGIALLKLDRPDEAANIFQVLYDTQDPEWSLLAGCYLLAGHVRNKEMDKANLLLMRLAGATATQISGLTARMPEETRAEIVAGFLKTAASVNLMKPDPDRVANVERALKIQEILRVGREYVGWTRLQYIRSLRVEPDPGTRGLAIARLEEWLRTDYPPTDQLTLFAVILVPELSWLCREIAKPGLALGAIDGYLFRSPGVFRPENLQLLLERARVHIAYNEPAKAEKDLEDYLRLALPTTRTQRNVSDAALMLGLLKEKRGDVAGAKSAWLAGKYPGSFADPALKQEMAGLIGLINAVTLSLLTDTFTDADAESVVKTALRDQGLGFIALGLSKNEYRLAGEVLRSGIGHADARSVLWEYAFQTWPFSTYFHNPVLFAGGSAIRTIAFGGTTSADQEKVIGELMTAAFTAYAQGTLGGTDMFTLLLTLRGNRGSDWVKLETKLPQAARGPMCYAFGVRCARIGKPTEATAFFKTALADAPADSVLRRLAGEELAKLETKK